jgi:hypothetical protein
MTSITDAIATIATLGPGPTVNLALLVIVVTACITIARRHR